MELIFKKYHKSEQNTEKNYLIYDPGHNQVQFTSDLYKSISGRNFMQSCENILIGPIIHNQEMNVRVLTSDGVEVSSNSNTREIFEAYLKDQGYSSYVPADDEIPENIQEFGTVYYFPA